MGPWCLLWCRAGVPLAPCYGQWWVWGAPSVHGAAWWGPWGRITGERPPLEMGRAPGGGGGPGPA